jgi:hypothetical protein
MTARRTGQLIAALALIDAALWVIFTISAAAR